MTTDYSIECALPYSDDFATKKQQFETAFNGLIGSITNDKKTFSRTLLVDDITNNASQDFSLDAYTQASASEDTLVMRESMLSAQADELFDKLEDKAKEGLKTEQGYTSPFYIAAWTLIRLGQVTHPDFPADKVSKKLANILPEEFREGEEESLRIIKASPYAEAADKVEYIYI